MKILNIKSKILENKPAHVKTANFKGNNKYFSPSNSEWSNSVYLYNKGSRNPYPLLDSIVLKYIKTYFNMYKGSKKSMMLNTKKRFSSTRKVWVSKVQIKHTSDKVIINTYVFDRINNIIVKKLNYYIKNNGKSFSSFLKTLNTDNILNNIYSIKKRVVSSDNIHESVSSTLGFQNKVEDMNKIISNNTYKAQDTSSFRNLSEFNNKIVKRTDLLLKYVFSLKKTFILKKIWENIKTTLYCYNFIKLNTLKYKKIFVINLLKIISKLYGNKEVVLNIIYLKNYYFNSTILSDLIAYKGKERGNNISKTFDKALTSIKITPIRKNIMHKTSNIKNEQHTSITESINNYNLDRVIRGHSVEFIDVEQAVLNRLEGKSVIGVRLEGAGRLTKRFTADRAVKKLKYVGTLKNIDSSFRGISKQMVRNTLRPNTQYSKVKSKNRIGSFGIKGWINSI